MINLSTIEADVQAFLPSIPTLQAGLNDAALILGFIPAAAPAALALKEAAIALGCLTTIQADLPAFLAAGQKIETDFLAAIASARSSTTSTPSASA